MPLIHVTLLEGRSPQQLRDFVQALTAAAALHLSAGADSVRVVVAEVQPSHFFVAGQSKDDHPGSRA